MSLYRRPGSPHWYCRFTVGGREIRRATGQTSKKAAAAYEADIKAKLTRRPGEHTFEDAAVKWLTERAHKKSIHSDKSIIAWLREDLQGVLLEDIDRTRVEALREAKAREASKATANRCMALLRAILRACQRDWGWLKDVPRVPMYPTAKPEPRFLTQAEFWRRLDELPPHLGDLALFAVSTGIRRGNILGLRWDMIRGNAAYIPAGSTKAGKPLGVPLNSTAMEVLSRWESVHPTHVFACPWMCPLDGGTAPIGQVTTKAWYNACRRAGVQARFHDLRHTWASWMLQAGAPLHAVQEIGGWSSYEMVRRYAHLSAHNLAHFAEKVAQKSAQ
jgi:integrase